MSRCSKLVEACCLRQLPGAVSPRGWASHKGPGPTRENDCCGSGDRAAMADPTAPLVVPIALRAVEARRGARRREACHPSMNLSSWEPFRFIAAGARNALVCCIAFRINHIPPSPQGGACRGPHRPTRRRRVTAFRPPPRPTAGLEPPGPALRPQYVMSGRGPPGVSPLPQSPPGAGPAPRC